MILSSLQVVAHAAGTNSADATPEARAQAKQHYEAGERAFRLGDFERAVKEWRESYELSALPLLLYNIAQAYRQKGDAKQALFFYQQYLATEPTGDSRATAEKRVDELKAVIAAQQNAQNAPPQGPERPAATLQPATVPATPTATVQHEQRPRRSWTKDPIVWSLLGVGVAGVAVGGALLGVAAHEGDLATGATTMSAFDMHHASDLNYQKGSWPTLAIGATAVVLCGVVIAIDHSRRGH